MAVLSIEFLAVKRRLAAAAMFVGPGAALRTKFQELFALLGRKDCQNVGFGVLHQRTDFGPHLLQHAGAQRCVLFFPGQQNFQQLHRLLIGELKLFVQASQLLFRAGRSPVAWPFVPAAITVRRLCQCGSGC